MEVSLLRVPGLRMGGGQREPHPSVCTVCSWGCRSGSLVVLPAPSHFSKERRFPISPGLSQGVGWVPPIAQGVGLIGGLPHQGQSSISSFVLHTFRNYSWWPASASAAGPQLSQRCSG